MLSDEKLREQIKFGEYIYMKKQCVWIDGSTQRGVGESDGGIGERD